MNLFGEFHPNRTMGKGSKTGGKIENVTNGFSVETTLHPKMAKFETSQLFSKRNFDAGFEISSVGILDISSYTKSEKSRVAGKHLT